jgi:hypothetical protein
MRKSFDCGATITKLAMTLQQENNFAIPPQHKRDKFWSLAALLNKQQDPTGVGMWQ